MELIIKGSPQEIAALVFAAQERQSKEYVLVRKPYQRRYSLVKVGDGCDGSFEDK